MIRHFFRRRRPEIHPDATRVLSSPTKQFDLAQLEQIAELRRTLYRIAAQPREQRDMKSVDLVLDRIQQLQSDIDVPLGPPSVPVVPGWSL